MTSRLLTDIQLGDEASNAFVLEGWGAPEVEHRWAVGRTSRLRVPVTERGCAHVIIIDVVPWLHPPQITCQRTMIGINGRFALPVAFTHPMAIGVEVPAALTLDGEIVLSLDHLDGPAGAAFDTYRDGQSMSLLVLSVRLLLVSPRPPQPPAYLPPAGVAPGQEAELIARFESLGHRCAFGLFQQRWGVDRIGLLRFAGIHTPHLVRGLLDGFAGLGTEADLHAFIRNESSGLYSVYDRVRQIWFNTSQLFADVTEAEVTRSASRRLAFLKRKFLEDLHAGEKIFIVNSPMQMIEAEALALFTALGVSARNTLVWTNQAGSDPPGTVRRVAAGLYHGQLDRADAATGNPSDAAWFSVCANVCRLLADG